MSCSSCGFENPAGQKFCSQCGTALAYACPKCGAKHEPAARFCGECGASLNAALGTVASQPSPIQPPAGTKTALTKPREVIGERRRLTVLFSDLVGSTEISTRLDPEEWRELVARYQQVATEAVARFDGHVAQYLGDGVLAFFGYPAAHEDDAERAVRAGLAIINGMAMLNAGRDSERLPALAARIGIHSGPVVVGDADNRSANVFGDTPNIAARVQAAAEPNTVVVSSAVHRLVSGMFVVEERGAHQLKGVPEPVELFRVVRLSGVRSRLAASAARGLTPFVGREDEVRWLMNRWARTREREGQVVMIVGEAGIGKSRLVRRFREGLAGTPHTWNECTGAPYFQNTPFYPVTEMLHQGYAERGVQSDGQKLSELERDLGLAGLKLTEAVPLIAGMLNVPLGEKYPPLILSPGQQRKRLLATLAEWLFGAARAQPLVMAVEDLHWFDASTLELIQLLVEQGVTSPLLLLYTARPEFHASWTPRAHHSHLTLNRLSARDVRELVGQVVATKALSEEAIDKVIERTGGVPLFVEELTRAVLERGDAKPASHEIPATLHDSLMARLDRLGPAKEVAQIASVIGREFSYELLLAVSMIPEDDLPSALTKLDDAELIYARGIPPEASYSFKHALIQDAAYEALLKSRRRELHRRVAVAMTEKFPALAETQLELVARHWTDAAEAELALAAWLKVAEASVERRAFKEAEQAYRRALEVLKALPESAERDAQELNLMSPFVRVLQITRGYGVAETGEAASRTLALAEKTQNLSELILQMFGTWANVVTAGDLVAAGGLADQLLDLARREGSAQNLGVAYSSQVLSRFWLGDLKGAEEHFLCGTPFFESAWGRFPAVASHVLGNAALLSWTLGRADCARERSSEAIAVAQKLNSPFEMATALYIAGWLKIYLRASEQAEASAAQSLLLAEKYGFAQIAAFARVLLGLAQARLGHPTEGVALLGRGLSDLAMTETRHTTMQFITWFAEAHSLNGAIPSALETIEEALNANPEELIFGHDAPRVQGELRLELGQLEMAEHAFRKAIVLAHKTGAKAFELRATTNLARLMRDTNRRDEARAVLAEIYNWFAVGFDTPDLKDAKALLDELNA